MLRDAVRSLAEAKIAPVRGRGRRGRPASRRRRSTPWSPTTCTPSTCPEEYGGAGADALATVIVIEEVARVCASSSLIPAVNKLGSLPVILSGSEELKKKYLGPLATRRARCSRTACPSRTPARTPAGMKTRAVRDGDFWVLNGVKRWITNAGVTEYYTVMAVTDPDEALQGHQRLRGGEVRRGRLLRRPGAASSASRARRPARSTSTTCASPPTA